MVAVLRDRPRELSRLPVPIGRCESCRKPDQALFPREAKGEVFDVCASCAQV